MKIESLLADCGLNKDEALGAAWLCGVSASRTGSKTDVRSKVSIFSTPRSPQELEARCGSIRDIYMALDLGDCLTLLSDWKLTFSVDGTLATGRLRTGPFLPTIWDTQRLYTQLLRRVPSNIYQDSVSLSEAFDFGLFFASLYGNIASDQNLDLLHGASPPIIKGLLHAFHFDASQRALMTGLHMALYGFLMGLDLRAADAVWTAFSYALFEKGQLKPGIKTCSASTFYDHCVNGLTHFLAKLAAHDVMRSTLLEGLPFSGRESPSTSSTSDAMLAYLDEEWPGAEALDVYAPEQFAITQKILIFYECLKSMLLARTRTQGL